MLRPMLCTFFIEPKFQTSVKINHRYKFTDVFYTMSISSMSVCRRNRDNSQEKIKDRLTGDYTKINVKENPWQFVHASQAQV